MSRLTRQRKAIRQVLEKANRPMSPDECLRQARRIVPGLGIATVYRNLRQLVDDGWLRAVALPGAANRYEIAGKRHHHHFHCRHCDRLFEVESCHGDFARMAPGGFCLERHEVILYGTCRHCASQPVSAR